MKYWNTWHCLSSPAIWSVIYAFEVFIFLSHFIILFLTHTSICSLPFPWLLSALIFGPVKVSSSGMACSIVILFLMLLFVIISIAIFKWKMNIGLALVMFVLYFAFVAMSLLLEYRIVDCEVIMEYVGFHWWSYSRCLFRRTWFFLKSPSYSRIYFGLQGNIDLLTRYTFIWCKQISSQSREKGAEFVLINRCDKTEQKRSLILLMYLRYSNSTCNNACFFTQYFIIDDVRS